MKLAMKAWKEEQKAAVARWMREATTRAEAAESRAAAAEARLAAAEASGSRGAPDAGAPPPASIAPLVAENRELIADAERRSAEAEALAIEAAELRAALDAATRDAEEAPQLRSENYDLAVKHRSGLQRLHQELAARRALEDRVAEYEHATASLEATVRLCHVAR